MNRDAWVEPWQPLEGYSPVPHGSVSDPWMRSCASDGPSNNLAIEKDTGLHEITKTCLRYHFVILDLVVSPDTCQWKGAFFHIIPNRMNYAASCRMSRMKACANSYCKRSVLFHCGVFAKARRGCGGYNLVVLLQKKQGKIWTWRGKN